MTLATAAACTPDPSPPPEVAPQPSGATELWWEESFNAMPVGWESPSEASQAEIEMVFSIAGAKDGGNAKSGAGASATDATAPDAFGSFMRAYHDSRPELETRAPAVHFGKPWRENAAALTDACFLSWKWRVRQHPAVKDDAWLDLAASLYVVIRMPGLFGGGRGFKFGWLAKPGKKGEKQRGLFQIAQRVGPATEEWQSERVDLCSLYRGYYGESPDKEKLLYVGLVTDADNTESIAAADYDELRVSRQ